MKKSYQIFLAVTFAASMLCFGSMVVMRVPFSTILSVPWMRMLLIIATAAPTVTAIILHISIPEMGGIKQLKEQILFVPHPAAGILMIGFVFFHFTLFLIFRQITEVSSMRRFFTTFPLFLAAIGLQEIGWQGIVCRYLKTVQAKPWKAVLAAALFQALWILPLVFIPGFVVLAQMFAYFAALVIGLRFILDTMYESSGSLLLNILTLALIFSLMTVIHIKQGQMTALVALCEALAAVSLAPKKQV